MSCCFCFCFVCLSTYFLLNYLKQTAWGKALNAIRDDEKASKALGKNVRRLKIESVVLGSMMSGLAGILLALNRQFISPNTFGFELTLYGWLSMILGGSGDNLGSIFGTFFVFGVLFSGHQINSLKYRHFFLQGRGDKNDVDFYNANVVDDIKTTRHLRRQRGAHYRKMTYLLKVENVVKNYNEKSVLDKVCFSMKEGEIIGLAGPNGAGKTTLLDIVSGFEYADDGKIFFFEGVQINEFSEKETADLGIKRTFQEKRPFTGMSVKDNLTVGGQSSESEMLHWSLTHRYQFTQEILQTVKTNF